MHEQSRFVGANLNCQIAIGKPDAGAPPEMVVLREWGLVHVIVIIEVLGSAFEQNASISSGVNFWGQVGDKPVAVGTKVTSGWADFGWGLI
jgi:hypothetical protein